MAYGPASATVGGVHVSGNGLTNEAGGDGRNVPNPVPLTAGVHQQLGPSFEVSGYLGWIDSGGGLRFRVRSSERFPLVLSAGARTGAIGIFPRDTYAGTFAVEAYPALSRVHEGWGARLVTSLGVAAGVFEYDLSLPSSFELSSDAPHGAPSEVVLRRELRLQAALGVRLEGSRAAVIIALQPWVVLAHSAPLSASCDHCQGVSPLSDFSQRWGLALLVTPAFLL
jgi:hypothetical protein